MSAAQLLQQFVRIIQDPTSNLTAAVLLLAALTLAVLIIIVALLLAVTRTPVARRGSGKTKAANRPADEYEYPELSAELAPRLPGDPAPRKRRSATWLVGRSGSWVIALLVVLGIASGYVVTSTEGYCRDACHGGDAAMTDAARGVHNKVACVSCHEDAAPLGIGGALVQRTAHMVAQGVPGIQVYAAPVASRRCLACHATVSSRLVQTTGGARMSHREPLAAGMACRDCHGEVGHTRVIPAVGMAKCVRCHDGKTAAAKCRSCHTTDTGHASAAAGASRGFPRVQLGPVRECGGCHDQTSCDACHGLRLPHPTEFMQWRHARDAAFGRKQLCYRCHTFSDCGVCHMGFGTHGTDWPALHKRSQPRATCSCHWLKLPEQARTSGGFCAVCH